MRFSRTTQVLAGSAALALALAGCGSSAADDADGGGDGETLTFASIPSEDSSAISADYEVVLSVLEEQLGVEIELQQATDYAAVIEALRAGQVDIAALGPFSYVTAKDGGVDISPVAGLANSPEEEPGYQSYGIVPAASPINDLAGFAGQTVCFVDPTSTSGYLYPSAGLLEAGVNPETGVTPVFAGGHDSSVLSVADGTCAAGFAFDTMVTTELIESGQLQEGAVRVVWESPMIPISPIVMANALPQETRDTITNVFDEQLNKPALIAAGVCTDDESCVLPEGSEWGYKPVDDAVYDGIRQVCEVTQSPSCVE